MLCLLHQANCNQEMRSVAALNWPQYCYCTSLTLDSSVQSCEVTFHGFIRGVSVVLFNIYQNDEG